MLGEIYVPRRLTDQDNRGDFDCGDAVLNAWFHRYAMQNQRSRNAVTYVTGIDDLILGYYALAAASITKLQFPDEVAKGRPEPMPCILLSRLAVHKRAQGIGVGKALVADAYTRALYSSKHIGASCLLIHAKDESAKAFYKHVLNVHESNFDRNTMISVFPKAK